MRRSPALKFIAVLLILAALLVLWGWRSWSPFGSVVHGDGYAGLLRSYHGSPWAPSKQTIKVLEADLTTFLSKDEDLCGSRLSSEPSSFWRQYSGYEMDGRRYISVNFLHKDRTSKRDCLNAVIVSGGGDFFWSSSYGVEKRIFSKPRCNAPM